MIKNYFKIAIAVLKRRKFFTFISLFGISFTLTILVVLTAFIDKVVGDNYPNTKNNRSLYISNIQETGTRNGGMNSSSSPLSFYFLDHYLHTLKIPQKIAISSTYNGTNTYVRNKKVEVNYKYTNADYWEILDYKFLEGKAFSRQQIDNAEPVAVITEDLKKRYFGNEESVVGKYIEADNVQYRVCGVVKNLPITTYMLYADLYLPYTVSKTDYKNTGYRGNYMGILLAPSPEEVQAMQKEFDQMIAKIPMESKDYDQLFCHAESFLASYVNTGNENNSGMRYAITAISLFVFIFMLLPTLNLVNINITRIMERSSEIGVRKAFGASSKTLVGQFLVENIILTLLGGIIGILLSLIILWIINTAQPIANLELQLNVTVLSVGLLICLIFGLLSGVYPAWRMSKLKIVNALKEQ